ncbi:hypothetical protein EXIGLDRAFT_336858 [Exidia glandulosa HHB12029]|uniref:F-box domain-containing protein n=1 Tax=Exidia glandulosa HHB12029 TaxID=1314781 RepID=A0A165CKQ8_EXIGL|nr:hypothetical protein EXIGLDRAFT_336858 [Exidia glandulosa HHB12029]
MSTPTFPQEVVDIIIDYAWELQCKRRKLFAKQGLRSLNGSAFNVLALVSRSWIVRARRYAFRDLTFERKWSPEARRYAEALLEHPLCTIREHVLRLQFHSDDSKKSTHDIADISYLRNFRNLKSLGLHDLVFDARFWPGEETRSSIFESVLPPTLENLELEGCTFPKEASLVEMIACATGLRSLQCADIFVQANEPFTGVPLIRPQHLTELSLTVRYGACLDVLVWISSAPVPPRITNLELQAISDESVPIVSRALRVFGPSVVTLSLLLVTTVIPFQQVQNHHPFATEADLSTLQNLQHLVTACSFSPWGGMGAEVPLILARLAEHCKTVQSITFHIHGVPTKEDILTMPWEEIIAALNGPSFRQLERIAFQLPPMWRDEQRDATRDMLKERVGEQLLANVKLARGCHRQNPILRAGGWVSRPGGIFRFCTDLLYILQALCRALCMSSSD